MGRASRAGLRRRAGVAGLCLGLAVAMAAGDVAADRVYRIMLVIWRNCDDPCRGFSDELLAAKIPADLFLRHAASPAALEKLVSEAHAMQADLVVTVGANATRGMVGATGEAETATEGTDRPVLFMMVPDPVAARILPSLDHAGRNISGTLQVVPLEAQLRAVRAYRPFARLGYLYHRDDADQMSELGQLRQAALRLGFALVTREVALDQEGHPKSGDLARLVGELAGEHVDYLYTGASPFLFLNRDEVVAAALASQLAVVGGDERWVRQAGALLAVVSQPYEIGRLTARKAEEILVGGKQPADIPIVGPERFSMLVNTASAQRLGLPPPPSLPDFVQLVQVGP
jgi:putative tryptophan/tyrosine transport system substrate-binding protein